MKILQVHNYYQFLGGEDSVLRNEYELLKTKGHEVFQYTKSNNEIASFNIIQKTGLLLNSWFSRKVYNEIKSLIKKEKPDICHVHNTLALITPAVYYACRELHVPVVQTLHNYRLLCTNALLFRDGEICEECIGNNLYHSIKYKCYRNSKIQTIILSNIIEHHKRKEVWNEYVSAYIALSDFSKNKFTQGHLPAEKIFVKPNFLPFDPGIAENDENFLLYAGRLDESKGIEVLLNSLNYIDGSCRMVIVGDGPLKSSVLKHKEIKYIHKLQHPELMEEIKKSYAVIYPSLCYETFGLLIIEAFACGRPVIASRLGVMNEIIEEGKTGLLFTPGSSEDLAAKIQWAYDHPYEMKVMGSNARKEYEEKYTAEKNYKIMMNIYEQAIKR